MKIIRFLTIILILLSPLSALAGSGESNNAPPSSGQNFKDPFAKKPPPVGSNQGQFTPLKPINTLNILNPAPEDQSIVFLRKIFGNVQGNILGGGLELGPTQGQILGRMMEVLNYGIMVIAGVLVSYIIITGVMNTAHEGDFMGKNFKSGWVIMRVMFGSVLLLPNQATGYSLAQWLVMWMAVQGVGLADNVWTRGLDYFKAGGTMYSAPDVVTDDMLANTYRIFMSQVCMYKNAQVEAEKAKAAAANNLNNVSGVNTGGFVASSNPVPQYAKNFVIFPGQKDKPSDASCGAYSWAVSPAEAEEIAKRLAEGPRKINFDQQLEAQQRQQEEEARCGEFRWYDVIPLVGLTHAFDCADYRRRQSEAVGSTGYRADKPEDNPKVIEFMGIYEGYKEAGVKALVKALEPAAKAVVAANGVGSTALKQQVVDAYINALIAYANTTEPARAYTSNVGRDLFDKYYNQMRDEGWIFAGRYYHVLGWIKQQTDSVSNFFFKTSVQPPLGMSWEETETKLKERGLPTELVKDIQLSLDYYRVVYDLAIAKQRAAVIPDIPKNLQVADKGVERIIYAVLTMGLSEVQVAWSNAMKTGGEPITKLQIFGKETLNIITASWIAVALIVASTMFAAGWFSAVSPGAYVVLAVLSILVPLYVTISLALFVSALVFGFYLPLIPYILFTFAAFGWGILLVIGMLVAPLMALLLIYPEGHDWVGRAEQGVLLLVSIFIRPTLLVLGLIIAMLFSKVAVDLINSGFDTIITDLSLTSGFTGGLAVIAFMIIYTSILFIIVQQVFTTCIVKLPEQVERLLGFQGAGAGVEMAATAAQQSEQSFSQAAQQIGQAGSGAVTSATQAGEKYGTAGGDHAKEDAKEAKKKGVSVEGVEGIGPNATAAGGGGTGGGPGLGNIANAARGGGGATPATPAAPPTPGSTPTGDDSDQDKS